MNKAKAQTIRERVTPLLEALAKELGLSANLGTGRFNSNNIRFTLEFADLGSEGQVLSKEVTDFKNLASNYGLKSSDLGRQFWSNGFNFTIVGLKTSRPKFPIQCLRSDGKVFKFPANLVKALLPPPPPVPTELVTFLQS